jgi:A/G-specific adenine glycosylase
MSLPSLSPSPYADLVLGWYAAHARDLPWRAPGVSPWAVLVSEIMLQQTPVSRVLPAYAGMACSMAYARGACCRSCWRGCAPVGAAWLSTARAAASRDRRHRDREVRGELPSTRDELLALPGIGAYTAAAVAVFAFGRKHAVLDTNVRRVLARVEFGREFPGAQPSVAEYRLAESLLPEDDAVAARWSVAVMELGALTCTAAAPQCDTCPVAQQCAWLAAGRPAAEIRPVGQTYEGTDRQCRGRLLAVLRDSREPVPQARLDAVWPDEVQRARALDGLVADGLVDPLPDGRFALPA